MSQPQSINLDTADISELQYLARARRLAENKLKTERYKQHPWPWLCEAVQTEDPHDKGRFIKPFPTHLAYLKVHVDLWFDRLRILVPKSRRMHISWTYICLYTWLMLFREHEYIYFVSRKEGRDESEGSLELVKRAKFVLNNQRNYTPPLTEQHRGRIVCPSTHSEINAVAQGARQLTQIAATGIFFDEMAFCEKARETFSAAMPTIEGTGRFTGVSSAYPSLFGDLCFDEAN